ncbi:MAG: zinc dependent phospholipase C family protein [Gemmatimonadetes bacterium]|nr:zinc dependent phospholipase C family protein [Gemmatimonadota bacterium]
MRSAWIVLALALVAVALTPSDAFAWTPGTHVVLGEAVLRSLALLPPATAAILGRHPIDFLYGSIAADTSLAKKYVPEGRHCHSWQVGFEIHAHADDERLAAFGLGYLAHLAADVVAHNHYVPYRLAVTSSTVALGHSYWESRFESEIGDKGAKRARELILHDHARSDALLDRILSPTLFSTGTNRRFFRGMVMVTDLDSWQVVMRTVADNSRWALRPAEVDMHLVRSFNYVMDLLARLGSAEPCRFDPSGEASLGEAKRLRRTAIREGGDARVLDEAERAFGLRATTLDFDQRADAPIAPDLRAKIA